MFSFYSEAVKLKIIKYILQETIFPIKAYFHERVELLLASKVNMFSSFFFYRIIYLSARIPEENVTEGHGNHYEIQWNLVDTFPVFAFSRLLCSEAPVPSSSHTNRHINVLLSAFAFLVLMSKKPSTWRRRRRLICVTDRFAHELIA